MSSEEVLLTVGHVRNHKTDGTLYLMGERMAWMQGSKDHFSVSHAYSDIKTQKISPETKDKVQLQVVLHDGGANTFHFNNPMGRAQQTEDRNSIKEILQQLLPNFRRKISSELEEKNSCHSSLRASLNERLLQKDPELFQLYKDLVVSQVISAEEFWANRANKVQNAKKSDQQQTVGVSAAFLADIKPQTDGCNGLKYNLTVDVIESIFRTYPMVKKKHAESVPHTLTESEFWTRFFQSHYFHRDRINMSSKDMFSDCAKNDDEDLKKAIEKKVSVPQLDLTNMNDGVNEPMEIRGATNHVNLSMIRRFNHHSTMVLKAIDMQHGSQGGDNSSGSTQTTQSSNISGTSKDGGTVELHNGVVNSHKSETETGPPVKKAKMSDVIDYEDLKLQDCDARPSLNLTKMERYLHGPTTVTASRYNTSEDVMQAGQSVATEIEAWSPDLTQRVSLVFVVLFISTGLFLFTFHSTQFNLEGFILVLTAAFLSGLRWTLAQLVTQKKEIGLHNPLDMMYHVQPWMILGLLPLSAGFEGVHFATSNQIFRYSDIHVVMGNFGLILGGGLLAFFLEFSEYLLLYHTSSLTLSIVGIFKEVCTLYLAAVYNGDTMTLLNGFGLAICILGIILHAVLKAVKRNEKSTAEQNQPESIEMLHDGEANNDSDEIEIFNAQSNR